MTSLHASTHVFCEAKHAVDNRVAEFYNTVTSSFYLIAAVVGVVLTPKHKTLQRRCSVLSAWICLAAIGAGSAVFHATLTFEAQLCDETPIMAFLILLIAGKKDCLRDGLHPATARTGILVFSFCLTFCVAVYVWTRVYLVFVFTFTIGVVAEVTVSSAIREAATPRSRHALKRATFLIALGGLVWAAELHLCSAAPAVWMLHPVWHLLSSLSAFCAVEHVSRLKEL